MSRNIMTGTNHQSTEDVKLRNTTEGKIIFTRCRGKNVALYLQDNRILAAQVLSDKENRIGAVYIGKVKHIVKNIDACFVEIADGEQCFLAGKDALSPLLFNRKYDGRIVEGDEILVQIVREAQKGKNASVTAHISLSDDYAAVSLGDTHIGYSGKLNKEKKEQIKGWLSEEGLSEKGNLKQNVLSFPAGMVVRTKAGDCAKETLIESVKSLLGQLRDLVQSAANRVCFSCVQNAPEEYMAVLEQLAYSSEYAEIVTDDRILYEKLVESLAPKLPDKQIRLYQDDTFSLCALYSLEQKLETALGARVWLKSGAFLVIQPTEALTVIDVNTGKYDAKKASCETYERINREAAQEIALQLRLRNLSGIIVVDFINMDSSESNKALTAYLQNLVQKDRIRTVVVDMTPLGLVEITRKKTNKPLAEQFATDSFH